ncbi:MAG: VanZ family protein [Gemmatimonadota bacterium]|nr:VanZ family protein [Gemmatimonadota bacterium]
MNEASKSEATRLAARVERLRLPVRLGYLGIILLATLSAFRIDLDPAAVAGRLQRMLRPTMSGVDVLDGARNLTLFAGWGLVWMLTSAPGRSWVVLRNAVLTGGGISLLVEVLQLLSDNRTASVLDLATNTGGALMGALVLVFIVLGLASRVDGRSFVGIPASLFALSYGAAVAGEALVPLFRQEQALSVSGGVLERLGIAVSLFEWRSFLELPLGDALLFFPAGVFGVAALYETGRGYRKAALEVGVGATLLFVSVEVAHGVLGIPIQAGAILVHVGAVAFGAWMSAAALPAFTRRVRGVDRPRLLTLGYVAVLAAWAFRPYIPETNATALLGKVTSEWWIPLRSLGMRMDMFSVVDVAAPFLLYLPLGGLLAVWPLTSRSRSAFVPAIYLAAAIEFLQILVAGRTLDVTDFLVQAAGAAVGWAVVRRGGFRPYGAQLSSATG